MRAPPSPWPFSRKLAHNLDALDDRIFKDNKAALMVIDGGVGEGKTTLAVHASDYINEKHGLPVVDLVKAEQLGLGGVDFTRKLRNAYEKKYPVLIYDEAGDFNRRGALTRFNAMLNRTFETFRAFKVLVILCLPSLNVLDQDIFDKNIPRLGLHLENRTNRSGNFKGFSNYRMLYIRERMKKLVVKSFAYGLVEPNFYGHFKDLPEERRKQLDRISTKGKLGELKKVEVKLEGLVSYKDLAAKLGRTERWVSMTVNELKIRHVKVIDKKKYFDENLLDILLDHIDKVAAQATPGRPKKVE